MTRSPSNVRPANNPIGAPPTSSGTLPPLQCVADKTMDFQIGSSRIAPADRPGRSGRRVIGQAADDLDAGIGNRPEDVDEQRVLRGPLRIGGVTIGGASRRTATIGDRTSSQGGIPPSLSCPRAGFVPQQPRGPAWLP